MFNISKLKSNDILLLADGRKVVVDIDRLTFKEYNDLKNEVYRVIRSNKTIYKQDNKIYKAKYIFDSSLLKKGDVIITFNKKVYIYDKKAVSNNQLSKILMDTRKITRSNITIAKRKNYKDSLLFNKEFSSKYRKKLK